MSSTVENEATDFVDLNKVTALFEKSLKETDDVFLKTYLEGYKEFIKFFSALGSLFSFVSSDIEDKIQILRKLADIQPESNNGFESISGMIEHEKANNLLKKSDYVSGSRTLLRLHRGLDFFRLFISGLLDLNPDENTSSLCSEVYQNTMANHHNWFVRTGAYLAMNTLPNKQNLFLQVCDGKPVKVEENMAIIPNMLEKLKEVYERVQKLYETHNLLDLP